MTEPWPEALVEKVAQAIMFAHEHGRDPDSWEDATDFVRDTYRKEARAALDASGLREVHSKGNPMLKSLVRAALFALGMGLSLPALAQQIGFYLPSTKPSDPAGTASASFVQAGVGTVCWFQQQTSGRFTIFFTGKGSDSTAAATVTVQASYGTGTPPANGAAATGTVVGNPVTLTSGAGGQNYSWSLINQLGAGSVLPNTPYWVDLQFKASAATGSINSITCSVVED